MSSLHSFLRPFLGLIGAGGAGAGLFLASDQLWLVCLGGVFLCLLYLVESTMGTQPIGGIGRADREQAGRESLARSTHLLAGFLLAGFLTLGIHLLREQVTQGAAIAGSRVIQETTQVSEGIYQRETTLMRAGQVYTFTRTIEGERTRLGTDSLQNPRLLAREQQIQRGRIFDATGRAIADRVVYSDTGYVQRVYPVPNMSYLAGFYNPTIYGLAGMERYFDTFLSGAAGSNPLVEEENRLLHRPTMGDDLYLTLVPTVQDAATEALGARKGAVVVLDAQSGAILALASYPHFDPNGLSFNFAAADWDGENQRIVDYWKAVNADPNLPMLNRATQGVYPPGSTFKTVTLAAGLDTGKVRPETIFTDTGRIQVEAGSYAHVDCSTCRPAGHTNPLFTLMEGYQWSLNVVFVELAVNLLGADPLVQYAQHFGFGRDYADLGVPVETSRLGNSNEIRTSRNLLAGTSYGQGEIQATTLQMALVAATIARGGELPRPYLVSQIVNPQGVTVQEASVQTLDRAVSPATANVLTQMMITSVQKGWANGAAIPGFAVGGKTGTAETGRGTTHAWFIGIAGRDPARPQYAVAVVLEDGGEGSRVAVPVARAALLAALQTK